MRVFKGLLALLLLARLSYGQTGNPIFSSKAYTVYPDAVTQGKYKAQALSATELTSDYRSPANLYKSTLVDFKFSINGKDNEMTSGIDHHFNCVTQQTEVLVKFGEPDKAPAVTSPGVYLKPSTRFKIRVDMKKVLAEFKKQGYYTCFNGDKIYKNDFKGVFVAGNTAPLIWDFNNLVNHGGLELKDPDGDGIYETTLILNKSQDEHSTASSWKLTKDISAFPQYHSDYKLTDALYNLALEEMQNAIEPDSTFRTGKEWSGVWTRDISYSIILSMAVLQPKVAMYSLMRKVKDGLIIQDTGTGGAYPVSSDRMIWGVAAWEVYQVTGDKAWLEKAYAIIKKSAAADVLNVYDSNTGLVRGESSFLDWREETYPRWMQPADIYDSECLGTNVIHFRVNQVLADMADLLGDKNAAACYNNTARAIKKGINNYLWIPAKGYYGQYLYGRIYKQLSPRSEALGEALSVFFNVADDQKQQSIVANTPVNAFGIPCIYPQIPNILPYHNNAVWPFVETYWAMAAAKTGNETSLIRAMSAIYRPAALFLTNKENFVASDGDYAGTQINSSNMLWSLSGNIALIYKVLFGMHYVQNGLQFAPFVPRTLAGNKSLANFKYRNAVLNINMKGYGNEVKSIRLDGYLLAGNSIPAGLSGTHTISIVLANQASAGKAGVSPDYTTPEIPELKYNGNSIVWKKIAKAVKYSIIKNGKKVAVIKATACVVNVAEFAEYQVIAVDANGYSSFASEPLQIKPSKFVHTIETETIAEKSPLTYQGFSGAGFVEISKAANRLLNIPIKIVADGTFAIDFRYANGNGPINTENKCAIRTLNIDGKYKSAAIFPQRGKGQWSNWGFSNPVIAKLAKGNHIITLQLKDANENMNGETNQAMIDYVRVIRIQAGKN